MGVDLINWTRCGEKGKTAVKMVFKISDYIRPIVC